MPEGKHIDLPLWLSLNIYSGLALAIAIIFLIYYILYAIGGWILVVILGVLPILGVIAVSKPYKFGVLMKESEDPKLFGLIAEICFELGLKFPDAVYVIPSSPIFVTGVFSKKLVIGLAGVRSLNQNEFKAILAHEFGHFYGKDTIMGAVFGIVTRAFTEIANVCMKYFAKIPFVGIFAVLVGLFFALYAFIFRVATLFYQRQVERRADLIASAITSKKDMYNGLLNVSTFTMFFDQSAYSSAATLLKDQRAFVNLYETSYNAYLQQKPQLEKNTMERAKGSWLSTHPALAERLDMMGSHTSRSASKPASELFKNFDQMEKDFTKQITVDVATNIKRTELYKEAVARQGRCRYCNKQFRQLDDLLKHEATHQQK